ncbi:MAG: hypothetical protein JNL30_03190 [Rubrivivax sp.]|nr:hypothetical protein [Rubrivivax sp.]
MLDVLHLRFTIGGLRKSREVTHAVWRESVEVEWKPGRRIRVMHPLQVLESRVQRRETVDGRSRRGAARRRELTGHRALLPLDVQRVSTGHCSE